MKRKITNILDKTTPESRYTGKIWYTRVNRFCRDLGFKYGQPTWKVAAIMSALSPRTSFENNCHDVEELLRNVENAKLKSPLFFKKALAIYNASCYNEVTKLFNEKTGRKTLSFWENIMLVGNRATLDVWMLRGLGLKGSLTDKKYREMEESIQTYANEVGIKAYELQAILWTTLRGKAF